MGKQDAEEEIYVCPTCGSPELQFDFHVWVAANEIDDKRQWELDVECAPEKDSHKTWCSQCSDHVMARRMLRSELAFPHVGFAVEHNGKCGAQDPSQTVVQTVWKWGEPGKGTVLEDVEHPCPACLSARLEELISSGTWAGLSGERSTRLKQPQ